MDQPHADAPDAETQTRKQYAFDRCFLHGAACYASVSVPRKLRRAEAPTRHEFTPPPPQDTGLGRAVSKRGVPRF